MLKTDDIVNYHSIIGGEITSTDHVIKSICLAPNNFGCDVAWITGKSGCVCLTALSNDKHPMRPYRAPLTRSQKRYQDYLDVADCYEDFKHYLVRTAYAKRMGLRA